MPEGASIWARDWAGRPFAFFDSVHLATLGLIFSLNLSFPWWRRHAGAGARVAFRYGVAGVLLANEVVWYVWNFATGQADLQTLLPLHLCSVLVYVGAAALVTKNQVLFEFLYFLGIGGAFQALMTPDIGRYGFPHVRFLSTFISHGLIFTAPIYLVVVEGLRPTWRSLRRTFYAANLYMVFVGGVNWLIGSNYLFIARKPDTPTLIDALGPWPYYIVGMEIVGLLTMAVLYAPFALAKASAAESPDTIPAA